MFKEVPLEEDAKDEAQEILFEEGEHDSDSDEEGQGVEEDDKEEAEEVRSVARTLTCLPFVSSTAQNEHTLAALASPSLQSSPQT